jgi:hypothetical protein
MSLIRFLTLPTFFAIIAMHLGCGTPPKGVVSAMLPGITTQPQSLTVAVGQPVKFSVTATGKAPLSYQWKRNNQNISGATSANFVIANALIADAGEYKVLVVNTAGSVISEIAQLTVNAALPGIKPQPQPITVAAGQTVCVTWKDLFIVTVTAPFSYQWQRNTVNGWISISGATNDTYCIENAQSDRSGEYRLLVSNTAEQLASAVAKLTISAKIGRSMSEKVKDLTWETLTENDRLSAQFLSLRQEKGWKAFVLALKLCDDTLTSINDEGILQLPSLAKTIAGKVSQVRDAWRHAGTYGIQPPELSTGWVYFSEENLKFRVHVKDSQIAVLTVESQRGQLIGVYDLQLYWGGKAPLNSHFLEEAFSNTAACTSDKWLHILVGDTYSIEDIHAEIHRIPAEIKLVPSKQRLLPR